MSTRDWPGIENNTSLESLLERQAFLSACLRRAPRPAVHVSEAHFALKSSGTLSLHKPQVRAKYTLWGIAVLPYLDVFFKRWNSLKYQLQTMNLESSCLLLCKG